MPSSKRKKVKEISQKQVEELTVTDEITETAVSQGSSASKRKKSSTNKRKRDEIHEKEDSSKAVKKAKISKDAPSIAIVDGTKENSAPSKKKRPPLNAMKPKNKSWMTHIAGLLIQHCIKHAKLYNVDPRKNIDSIDWTLPPLPNKEVLKLCTFMSLEYPESNLEDIEKEFVSLHRLKLMKLQSFVNDEMPKPPLSPYLMFYQQSRIEASKRHPKYSQTDIAKHLGEIWRSMSSKQKEKYSSKYKKLKQKYTQDLETFYKNNPKLSSEFVKSKKSKEIKKPTSAYIEFCKVRRPLIKERNPGFSPRDITVELGKIWRCLSKEERDTYNDMYKKAQHVYNESMEESSKIPTKKSHKTKTIKSAEVIEESSDDKDVDGTDNDDEGSSDEDEVPIPSNNAKSKSNEHEEEEEEEEEEEGEEEEEEGESEENSDSDEEENDEESDSSNS